MPSNRFQPFVSPESPAEPEKIVPVKPQYKSIPSVYDGNPAILDEVWVRLTLDKGTNSNSIQDAVLEWVPGRGLGTLASRLNIAIKPNGKVFVKPECGGINALLVHYGFRALTEDNKEGCLVFQK